jgi:hypothetical protein
MKKNLVKGVALVAVSILGVTGLSLTPANATAANKTVIVQSGNTLSGLNPSVSGRNLVTNVEVTSPTGAGFTYYNDKIQLIRNTAFGTFKIAQNTCSTNKVFGCFKVAYTVKKGLRYSDGTLITAQDLLLSHAISSSDYSIKAGLGDPKFGSRFDSLGYGGAYDNNTRANSMSLSDDNFTLTLSYEKFMPDWQILGPGPGTVHALVGLAKGKRTLQSARTNAAYKAVFEDAYFDAIDSTGQLVNVPARGLSGVDAIYVSSARAQNLDKGDRIFGTGLNRSGTAVDKIEPIVRGSITADTGSRTFTTTRGADIFEDMAISIPRVINTAGFANAVAGSNTIEIFDKVSTDSTKAGIVKTSSFEYLVGDQVLATLNDPSKITEPKTTAFSALITAVNGNVVTLDKALPAGSTLSNQAFTLRADLSVSGTVSSVNYDTNAVTFTSTRGFSSRTNWDKVSFTADATGTGLLVMDDYNVRAVTGNVTSKSVAQISAQTLMAQMATRWSTAWNITTVTSNTNPLLLVSNGGFRIESCGASSCTLGTNPLGNVGGSPRKTGNMEKLIFKFPATGTTFNPNAVGQAIKNGEVDLYSGEATASFWATVNGDSDITTRRSNLAVYEHFDIRSGDAAASNVTVNSDGNCAAPYDGPFKGNTQRAKDLRKAMLLVVPRQTIANTYVGKIFDSGFTGSSPMLNSSFSLITETDYTKVVAGNSAIVAEFSRDQNTRNAAALALMRKYYPNAGPGSDSIRVKMLTSTAARRVDIALQIQLQADKVGIKLTNTASTAWSNLLNCNNYDVSTFAWSKSSISQTGYAAQYSTTGSNNRGGWTDPVLDNLLLKFEDLLSSTALISAKVAAEKQLWSNFWTIQQYQWPGVSTWNKDVKGVLPSPLNPNVTWNYWALGY